MPGPGKGYVGKKDPRRSEWEGLQGTSAGGSDPAASAAAYNPTYDPGTGTIASPSGGGRIAVGAPPPPPRPTAALEALRRRRGKSGTSSSRSSSGGIDVESAVTQITGISKKEYRQGQRESEEWIKRLARKQARRRENRELISTLKEIVPPGKREDPPTMKEMRRGENRRAKSELAFSRAHGYKRPQRFIPAVPPPRAPDLTRGSFKTKNGKWNMRDVSLFIGEVSRQDYKKSEKEGLPAAEENPWKGKSAKPREVRQTARKLARQGTPLLASVEQQKRDSEIDFLGMVLPKDAVKFLSESMNAVSGSANVGGVNVPVAASTGANTDPEHMTDYSGMIDLAATMAGIGMFSRFAKGGKAAAGALQAERAAGKGGYEAAKVAAGSTKTIERINKVRKVTGSAPYRGARRAGGYGALGAGAVDTAAGVISGGEFGGYTLPAVTGTVQGAIERPGETAKTTVRNLLSSVAAPFAIGGALATTASRGINALEGQGSAYEQSSDYIFKPTERLWEETLYELNRMKKVYGSKDADKIADATAEDYGLLNAIGAYALARPVTKGAVRGMARGLTDSKAGAVIKLPEVEMWLAGKSLKGRAVSMFGRAVAGGEAIMDSRNIRKANGRLNQAIKTTGNSRVWDVADRVSEARAKVEGVDVKDARISPGGFAAWLETKALPATVTDAQLRKLRDAADATAEDQAYIDFGLATPELRATSGRLAARFLNMRRNVRQKLMEAADAYDEEIRRLEGDEGLQRAQNVRNTELLATAEALSGKKAPNRPEVEIETVREQQKARLDGYKQSAISARQRLATIRKKIKEKKGPLTNQERAEVRRLREEVRGNEAEAARQEAAMRALDAETRLYDHPDREAKIKAEERALQAELATLRKGQRVRDYKRGRADERKLREGDRARAGQDRLKNSSRVEVEPIKSIPERNAAARRLKEVRARLKELGEERSAMIRERTDARVARNNLTNAERKVRSIRRYKPEGTDDMGQRTIRNADPRLARIAGEMEELRRQEAATEKAIERADRIRDDYANEIGDRLSASEIQAIIAEVDRRHGTEDVKADTTKTKIKALEAKLRRIDKELDDLAATSPGKRAKREMENRAIEEKAAIRGKIEELEMDNAAALRGAEIRAAIATAKQKKKAAREAPILERLQIAFDRQVRAAREQGLLEAVYIHHKSRNTSPVESGNPAFSRLLDTSRDKQRTGEMARKGDVDRSLAAVTETLAKAAARFRNSQASQWLLANAVHRVGKKYAFTKNEVTMMARKGEIPKNAVILNERFLTDPERLGTIINTQRDVAPDRIMELPTGEEQLAQKIAAEGEGSRYVVIDRGSLEVLKSVQMEPAAWERFFFALNRISSKAVLGLSPSWALAQPIAEFLILAADHSNPARLLRAFNEVKKIHEGGDTAARRGLARLAGVSYGLHRAPVNSRAYQKEIAAGMGAAKELPGTRMMKEAAKLETLGRFDKWKGAWIREAGVLAELDRELSLMRRAAKAASGQMDEIEMMANKLSTMDRPAQIKWLNGPEGMAAAERLWRNLDASLGNWTDIRPGAEQMAASVLFFYPFVRFSINWTLRTFPKRHPIKWNLASLFGQFQAETLERLMGYDPQWMSQWAVAAVYGGDGPPLSLIPLNRYAASGNALFESGFLRDQDIFAGVAKAVVPIPTIFSRVLLAEDDQYGNPIADPDDPFGEPDPSQRAKVAQLLDESFSMVAPIRELMRENGFTFRDQFAEGWNIGTPGWDTPGKFLTNQKEIFTGKSHRKPKAGDDPNILRDLLRRNLIAGIPMPAKYYEQEQNVNALYEKYDAANETLKDSYPKVNYNGVSKSLSEVADLIKKRESSFKEKYPASPLPPRSPRDKKLMDRYQKINDERAEAQDIADTAARELVRYTREIGVSLGEDSSIASTVAEQNRQERKTVREDWEAEYPANPYPGYHQAKKDLAAVDAMDPDRRAATGTPVLAREVALASGKPTRRRAAITENLRLATRGRLEDAGYRRVDLTDPSLDPETKVSKKGIVTSYRGEKVLGNISLKELADAERRNLLDRDPETKALTTPRIRRTVAQQEVAARKVAALNKKADVLRAKTRPQINIEGDEGVFVNEIARRTGLSPKVVAAWTRSEGGNSFGDWNRLNIGHTDSGPIGLTGDAGWSDPKTAAGLTAQFLKGEYGGASDGIQAILPNAKGASDEEQIALIANSGWATNPDYHSLIASVYGDVTETVTPANPKAAQRLKAVTGKVKQAEKRLTVVNKKAKQVGLKPFEVEGGKMGTDLNAPPEPFDGKFSGSRRAVSMLLGRPVWGDHMPTDNMAGGPDEYQGLHSSGGFHDLENAYAQDIGSAGGRAEEGEAGLGYDQATIDTIRKNLQKMGSEIPDDFSIGQDWSEVLPNGYEVQLLSSPESDHGDHIHIGMKWVGAGVATGGTASGSSTGGGGYGGGGSDPTGLPMLPPSGQPTDAMAALQNFRNPDGTPLAWGSGTPPYGSGEMISAAETIAEASQNSEDTAVKSAAEGIAMASPYKKIKKR